MLSHTQHINLFVIGVQYTEAAYATAHEQHAHSPSPTNNKGLDFEQKNTMLLTKVS